MCHYYVISMSLLCHYYICHYADFYGYSACWLVRWNVCPSHGGQCRSFGRALTGTACPCFFWHPEFRKVHFSRKYHKSIQNIQITLHSSSFNFIQLHSLISIEVKHARWSGEAGLWPAQIVLKASKASLSALRWSALRLFGQRLSCCLTPATNGNDFSKKPSKHDSGWLRATDCPFVDLKVFQSLEPLRFPAFPRRVDTQSISELCYWWLWI